MTESESAGRFDAEILAPLAKNPFFRMLEESEVDCAFEPYRAGDHEALVARWRAECTPTRVRLGRWSGGLYERARKLPSEVNGLMFVALVRAALVAGQHFRARLSPSVRKTLEGEFPWLERRHEQVGPGWAPPLRFPDAFRRFIDVEQEAHVRWSLCTALNEVQQSAYSHHLAERLGVPALHVHADRERDLAMNYLRHAAPPVSRALFRQALIVLDGLNAAVFETAWKSGVELLFRVGLAWRRGQEWPAFEAGLRVPQALFD